MTWLLAAAFVTAPIADTFFFGIHDHIAVADGDGVDVSRSGPTPSVGTHHCELSASPAESMPALLLEAPIVFRADIIESPTRATTYTPLVQLAPPDSSAPF